MRALLHEGPSSLSGRFGRRVTAQGDSDLRGLISDERLLRLYDYWDALRGDRSFPARRELDPLALTFILGNLLLIDVLPGPHAFRIRLHGTALATRLGTELTGRMLTDHPDPIFREQAAKSFAFVARTGRPYHWQRDRLIADERHPYETLMLPLSDDGAAVDTVLVGLFYLDGQITVMPRVRLSRGS